MNIRQVIQLLKDKGYKVDTYTRTMKTKTGRKGNSLRITRLEKNGIVQTFPKSNSAGNKTARGILGIKVSPKLLKHLQKNRARITKEKLTKAQARELKKFNRELKKLGKERYSKVSARRHKKRGTWKETRRAMKNIKRHYKRIAYDKNVEILISRLENAITRDKSVSYSFSKAVSEIKKFKKFSEDALVAIYQVLYEWENKRLTNSEAEGAMLRIINNISHL